MVFLVPVCLSRALWEWTASGQDEDEILRLSSVSEVPVVAGAGSSGCRY